MSARSGLGRLIPSESERKMPLPDQTRRDRFETPQRQSLMLAAGLGVLAGTAAFVWHERSTRNPRPRRRPDSAPGRTARQLRFGRYAVTGRTVIINTPRAELYAFWRDFANLPRFMSHVKAVEAQGDLTRWTITGPLGRDVRLETRIVDDREGAQIAWRSTEESDIDTEGKVMFRDAPAGRGTEVEAIISYVPPAGEIGRWVAKVLQAEPALQARRELKRLKMLMETGEIATSATRRTEQE
jgi:uncharacterized membrane protein